MGKMYINYAKYSRELEKEIKKYKYVRDVFLESENLNEQNIIEKIQDILDNEKIKDENEMNKVLEKNKIFEFEENITFNIRRITCEFKNEKINIINCEITFLFKEVNELFYFLEDYTGIEKVGNIELRFPLVKGHFKTRKNCKEIVKELLNGKLHKNIDENELVEFFKDKEVIYSEEIKFDEIRTLKDVTKHKYFLKSTLIKGVLMFFVNPENMNVDEMYKIMKDINFYIFAKSDTNSLYAEKIDQNYKESKVKVILTI